MKRLNPIVCSLAMVLLAPLLCGAEKAANFSGTWKLTKTERSFQPPLSSEGSNAGGRGGRRGMSGGGGESAGGEDGFPGGGGGGFPGGGSRGGARGGFPGGAVDGRGRPEQQDLQLIITQSETEITLEQVRGSGDPRSMKQTYTLDGQKHSTPDATGRAGVSVKARVKKDKVLIEAERRMSSGGRDVTVWVREELSLSKDGQVLTRETSTDTPQGMTRVKQRFQKL